MVKYAETYLWGAFAFSHEDMEEPSEGKKWLGPNSPSMDVIRKHSMDKQWLALLDTTFGIGTQDL